MDETPTPQESPLPAPVVPNAEVPNAEIPNGGELLGAGSRPAPAPELPPSVPATTSGPTSPALMPAVPTLAGATPAAEAPDPGFVSPQLPEPPLLAAAAPPPPPHRRATQRSLGIVAAVFLLVASAFVGFGARDGWFTSDSSSTATSAPSSNASTVDNSNASSGVDASSAADAVEPAIVNLTSITDNGVAAGTGMLVSSKGLVVTNHHVISGAQSVQVEVGGDGDFYDAHVVGYSISDDVAVVQIEDVSGLPTISTTSDVAPDDLVQVIGNALGRGGEPTVSPGRVVALSQSITATDETGTSAERLTGMIQISASVQPGQSGGAVVNADGDVVGMTTAAAVNGGYRFGFENGSTEAYAIPIARALAAVKEIGGGTSTADVHVGARAVLGVAVQATTQRPAGGTTTIGTGVPISGVTSGGPAENAGITAGSTIVAIGDIDVNSVDEITRAMNSTKPGDTVRVTWIDPSGDRHTTTLEAAEGPPA